MPLTDLIASENGIRGLITRNDLSSVVSRSSRSFTFSFNAIAIVSPRYHFPIFLAILNEFIKTLTEDMAMANDAIMGLKMPTAASGMPMML